MEKPLLSSLTFLHDLQRRNDADQRSNTRKFQQPAGTKPEESDIPCDTSVIRGHMLLFGKNCQSPEFVPVHPEYMEMFHRMEFAIIGFQIKTPNHPPLKTQQKVEEVHKEIRHIAVPIRIG
ncbi:hypothetical protein JOB18_014541 [Solea senegalensis]|uniref:Uncharacterized protein n=1 Tax=Solea senegalensis TaxID=28829 RepID=A0AAV6SIX1_SOLSE|nr:hypothetical protein JOB18_014541 [Solea senegalensis]